MNTKSSNFNGFLRKLGMLTAALAYAIISSANAATVYVELDGNLTPEATGPVTASASDDQGSGNANLATGEFKAYAEDSGSGSGFGEAGISSLDRLIFTNTGIVDQTYSFSMSVDGTYAISAPATSLSTSFIGASTSGTGGTGGQTNTVSLQHRVSTSSPFNNLTPGTQGVGSYSVTTQTLNAFDATLTLSNVVIAPEDSIEFYTYLRAQANTTSGSAITDFTSTATLALLVGNSDFSVNVDGGVEALDWITVETVVVPIPAALPLFASGLAGFGFLGWQRKRLASIEEDKGIGVI